MYYFRGSEISSVTVFFIFTGYLLNFFIGYILSAYFIKKGNFSIAYIIFAIGVIGATFFTFYPANRLIHIGSYEEYLNETAPYLWQSSDFIISAIIIAIFFLIPFLLLLKKDFDDLKKISE